MLLWHLIDTVRGNEEEVYLLLVQFTIQFPCEDSEELSDLLVWDVLILWIFIQHVLIVFAVIIGSYEFDNFHGFLLILKNRFQIWVELFNFAVF